MRLYWQKQKLQLPEHLFEKKDFKNSLNRKVMKSTISFLIEIERFNDPLF